MQNNTETIFEMGLLAELAYLRLEDEFWDKPNSKNKLLDFNNTIITNKDFSWE